MPCVSPFSGCSLIGPCQHGFGYEGLALGRYLDPEGFGYRYQIFWFRARRRHCAARVKAFWLESFRGLGFRGLGFRGFGV